MCVPMSEFVYVCIHVCMRPCECVHGFNIAISEPANSDTEGFSVIFDLLVRFSNSEAFSS